VYVHKYLFSNRYIGHEGINSKHNKSVVHSIFKPFLTLIFPVSFILSFQKKKKFIHFYPELVHMFFWWRFYMIEMERHYSMLRSLFNKEKSLKPITAKMTTKKWEMWVREGKAGYKICNTKNDEGVEWTSNSNSSRLN